MSEPDNKEQINIIKEILEPYKEWKRPLPQEEIIQILKQIQEKIHCLPKAVQEQVAAESDVSSSVISCLVKMYPSLRETRVTYTITMCTGGRCYLKSAEIMNQLKHELRIGKNGISEDGQIALRTRPCLKRCRTAPNVLINGKLCPNATVKKILRILRRKY